MLKKMTVKEKFNVLSVQPNTKKKTQTFARSLDKSLMFVDMNASFKYTKLGSQELIYVALFYWA